MARERDKESGKYTQEYGDDEFIEVIESSEMPSTAQVAAQVGCSYTLAYHRLNQLANEEQIQRFKIGNSFAWSQY